VDGIISLFSADAEVSNVTDHEPHRGREGAERFWSAYRHTFEEVRSEFRNVDRNSME
jgi:hypothetical protein